MIHERPQDSMEEPKDSIGEPKDSIGGPGILWGNLMGFGPWEISRKPSQTKLLPMVSENLAHGE